MPALEISVSGTASSLIGILAVANRKSRFPLAPEAAEARDLQLPPLVRGCQQLLVVAMLCVVLCGCKVEESRAPQRPRPALSGEGQSLQARLGYPSDAKLLILNADDLAMSHSEDIASFAALDQRLVSSASVMVPCPWFTEVVQYAKTHPKIDLGLHLTLTSEWQTYRWGPVSQRALVPSLVGPDGYFYRDGNELARHAKIEDVETEIRAQLERARSMGLEPSHLDAHMDALYATPEFFQVLLKVAHEYNLPVRTATNYARSRSLLSLMDRRDPLLESYTVTEYVPTYRWKEYYVDLMRNLQPGVSEIFVHLALDNEETRAIMTNHPDWGASWRQREVDAISSSEVRNAIDENHIILISWRNIQSMLADESRARIESTGQRRGESAPDNRNQLVGK